MIIQLLLLLCLAFQFAGKNKTNTYIYAVVLWHVFILAIVNLLSSFSCFRKSFVFASYLVMDVVLGTFLISRDKSVVSKITTCIDSLVKRRYVYRLPDRRMKWNYIQLLIVCILAFTFVYAFLSAPYNWDSNTYHLTRIAEWVQNKSVSHFATANTRQVSSPVLAEYVNAVQCLLLGQKDILVNMLQWSSYFTNAVFIFLIAKKLRGSRNTCIFASFLYVAIPIAFAESTTTQVDNFATMWLLFSVCLILDFILYNNRLIINKATIEKVAVLALCVAFAYMAKPSVCVSMLVFIIWMIVMCLKRKTEKKVILFYILFATFIVLVPNIPEWYRNYKTFGSLSSSEVGAKQIVGTIKPHFLAINFLKNFVWNLYVPGFSALNGFITQVVYKLAYIANNLNINDPMIAENGIIFAYPKDAISWYSCDQAHNPVLFWSSIVAGLYLFVSRNRNKSEIWYKYCICTIISFILFCVILRWEPFINRYLVSYFALLCPMVAVSLQQIKGIGSKQNKYISDFLVLLCLINVLFAARYELEGHIFSRPEGYFAGNNYGDCYISTCTYIIEKNFKKVGLYFGEDSYEYPIWAMLNNKGVVIKQVNTNNETSKYEDYGFIPDCVLVSDKLEYQGNTLDCHGVKYCKNIVLSNDYLQVFEMNN